MIQELRKMPVPHLMVAKMTLSRRLLLASLGLFLAESALHAGTAKAEISVEQATTFIDVVGRGLMDTVNGASNPAAKAEGLERIIENNVDISAVARFCIGRFWRIATPEQQKEYLELFHQVLVRNITGRVGEYQGVSIVTNRATAREDGVAVTTTVTRPNNAPNRVDWLVTSETGKPRVIDVIAEGTSLRLTQRNDYLAFLSRNNNSVQALIEALRQQAKGG
jgi:phospholipid transport system substrate-binding protein